MYRYILCLMLLVATASAAPVYIAEGDPLSVGFSEPNGLCWYFPFSERIEQDRLYAIPAVFSYQSNTTYSCALTGKQTANMKAGRYTLVYSYPVVANGKVIRDVTWEEGFIVSAFSGKIDVRGKQSSMVMEELAGTILTNGVDGIHKITVHVETPELSISSLDVISDDTIRVAGTSNYNDGTIISVVVDEEENYAKHTLDRSTFVTQVHRNQDTPYGSWKLDATLPLQDMYVGWHNITAYANDLQVSSRFPISQSWEPSVTPTQYIKYFWNGSIQPEVVTVKETVTVIQEVDRWHTATPTPAITNILGDVVVPMDGSQDITPTNLMVLTGAVLVAVGVLLWKK